MESNKEHSVIYKGELVENLSLEQAKQNLVKLFKLSEDKAEQLIARSEYTMKKGLSAEQAKIFKDKIDKVGLVCEIDPPIYTEPLLEADNSSEEFELEPRQEFSYEYQKEEIKKEVENPYQAPETARVEKEGCFCRQCGKQIHKSASRCPFCHTPQIDGKPKSKGVAALLGILLGFLGAHRFYLGQWWGIFYLFFGFIGWIIAIVESIVFLATSKESWERQYGNVRSNSGLIVVAVIGGVAMIGILAAIALPAYQDYTMRAKVAEVLSALEPTKKSISDFARENSELPEFLTDIDNRPQLNHLSIEPVEWKGQKHLVLTFTKSASPMLDGETLIFSAHLNGSQINWDCSGGTLASKYRPTKCRTGRLVSQQSNDSTRLVRDSLNQYSFRVPSNWAARTDLNTDANFQYANLVNEEYMILFQHPKENFPEYSLEDYATLLSEDFQITDINIQRKPETSISGLRVLNYEIQGRIESTALVYQLGFIQGKDHYYYFLFWTLPNKQPKAFPTFRETLNSFKENRE